MDSPFSHGAWVFSVGRVGGSEGRGDLGRPTTDASVKKLVFGLRFESGRKERRRRESGRGDRQDILGLRHRLDKSDLVEERIWLTDLERRREQGKVVKRGGARRRRRDEAPWLANPRSREDETSETDGGARTRWGAERQIEWSFEVRGQLWNRSGRQCGGIIL